MELKMGIFDKNNYANNDDVVNQVFQWHIWWTVDQKSMRMCFTVCGVWQVGE